jgi:hypothetical protein
MRRVVVGAHTRAKTPSAALADSPETQRSAMHGAVVVAWPRTGAYTRKRVEAFCPERLPVTRESAAMHVEVFDAVRDRRIDGRDARGVILRAAEAAPPGQLQEAIDALVAEILCMTARDSAPLPRSTPHETEP